MTEEAAEEEWIESPGGWDNDGATSGAAGINQRENGTWNENQDTDENDNAMFGMDLFANNDPRDTFRFDLTTPAKTAATTTTIQLQGFTLESDETAQSTGVTLWQAAPRLATFLMEQQQQSPFATKRTSDSDDPSASTTTTTLITIAGSKVLELGAGLGLCGIVAHHLGAAQVVMTDGDTQTLQQMRDNVRENPILGVIGGGDDDDDAGVEETETKNKKSTSIECRQLIWGSSAHMEFFQSTYGRFDIILGAGVIYTQESMDPLFDTVVQLLEQNHQGGGRFVLSRYTKWNSVSDDVVLAAARARGLGCTQPDEGIFVFSFLDSK